MLRTSKSMHTCMENNKFIALHILRKFNKFIFIKLIIINSSNLERNDERSLPNIAQVEKLQLKYANWNVKTLRLTFCLSLANVKLLAFEIAKNPSIISVAKFFFTSATKFCIFGSAILQLKIFKFQIRRTIHVWIGSWAIFSLLRYYCWSPAAPLLERVRHSKKVSAFLESPIYMKEELCEIRNYLLCFFSFIWVQIKILRLRQNVFEKTLELEQTFDCVGKSNIFADKGPNFYRF